MLTAIFRFHSVKEKISFLISFCLPQVDKGTCKLAYMRAALSALASVHGTTLSWMKSLGGKEALLGQYGTIKEHLLPRNKVVRSLVEEAMFPFLMYMTRVQPDIAQQLMVRLLNKEIFRCVRICWSIHVRLSNA